MDNGSTDGGRELAGAAGDARITLLDLATPGPGGYAGRNVGIRAATGDWIAFLDADDLWQPDHLAVLAEGISADPNVRAAATRFDHVFDDRAQPQRIAPLLDRARSRSEEHTSELQSLMRISYAVFCLKKQKTQKQK